ncbi:MAG: S8 family peptidase [Deltaproteobacteria bacterium]|nr:S8 family peptidase [Deltaproteobacteria bacterium]
MVDSLRHIFLDHSGESSEYTSPPTRGAEFRIPPRPRASHSAKLKRQLDAAWQAARQTAQQRTVVSLPIRQGLYLEFESAPDHDLVTKSLEDRRAGIRLLNIRTVPIHNDPERMVTRATVYIPTGKEGYFLEKVRKYAEEETKSGKPKNEKLVNSIEDVRLAVLESFWQDERELLPDDNAIWCEIWLRGDEDNTEQSFRGIAAQLGIDVQDGALRFPERIVVLAKANRSQLAKLIESSPDITEFRRAKETARFFLGLNNKEQTEWAKELRSRLSVSEDPVVAVTILDTGANNGHMLLEPILKDSDCHAVDPKWEKADHRGHGTLMCGVASYGDLQEALESHSKIEIYHCLESVKIIPPQGVNDPKLYGDITIQGVSRAEIQKPNRSHIGCMAITSKDGRDRGRPSSWSAAIDKLTSGYDDDQKRLFIVAAGNIEGQEEWPNYPDSNLTNSIHDPGQSWNALTVGAFTNKARLTDPDLEEHEPMAPAGGLSPFSSTSLTWEGRKWPIKPDIVLEGGNIAWAPDGFVSEHDDLAILSTGNEPTKRQFDFINATSAATAQAAWMAAQIQAAYPEAWPETIRGLLVHSAQWTETMIEQFLTSENKTNYARLLRICGYGVPDLDRALTCYRNSLTLIAQEEIQPYDRKTDSGGYRTKEMHLHELPWPKDVLLSLGEAPVILRITLSYFIEPSPGEVGWKDRYRYASHALRFDLNNVGEESHTFLQRLNAAAREDGEKPDISSGSERWRIGSNGRDQGSIHSDIWPTTAAALATCNMVGVYPVIGWWRERPWLDRWERKTRYSLIVSIHTPVQDVDIYTPVANMVSIPIIVKGQQ